MRVAFDVSQAGIQKAGCGFLAYSLARELVRQNKVEELTLLRTLGTDWWDPQNVEIVVDSDLQSSANYKLSFYSPSESEQFWSAPARTIERELGRPHVLHSNNFYMPAPMPYTKTVYTLHDMTVFECPQYTTEANRIVCARGIVRAAAGADVIVANSAYTRENFLEYFPMAEDRVRVISLGSRFDGIDPALAQRPAALEGIGEFVLCVGTIEPRKNFESVVEAFQLIADQTQACLVFAGKVGWLTEEFPALVYAAGLRERVHFLSYVTDSELQWLYLNTRVFVYPSHWEGFGMPVLEAMSLGAPVVVSSRTSLPEVAGAAGIQVEPSATTELGAAMLSLLTDEHFRQQQQSLSLQEARRYSWASGAATLSDIYAELTAELRSENGVLGRAFRRDLKRRITRLRSDPGTRKYVMDVAKAVMIDQEVRRTAITRAREVLRMAFWPK